MKNKITTILKPIIGIFAIVGFFTFIYLFISYYNNEEPAGIPTNTRSDAIDSSEIKELSLKLYLDKPSRIYNTDLVVFNVLFDLNREYYRTEYDYIRNKSSNIIIYNDKIDKGRLVFSKPSQVSNINYPSQKSDSLQNFIIYTCISNDSNGDGLLNYKDNDILYISDLEGTNLQQITPDSMNVNSYSILNGYKELFISLEQHKQNNSSKISNDLNPKTVLWYDLHHRVDFRKPVLDNILERARKIINDTIKDGV